MITFFGFFYMCDLGVSFTFHFLKQITESFVIFSRNGVLILRWKENKEAGAICFEIRLPRKMSKELLRRVPSKIYGSYFILEDKQKYFLVCQWFGYVSSPRNGDFGFIVEYWRCWKLRKKKWRWHYPSFHSCVFPPIFFHDMYSKRRQNWVLYSGLVYKKVLVFTYTLKLLSSPPPPFIY